MYMKIGRLYMKILLRLEIYVSDLTSSSDKMFM